MDTSETRIKMSDCPEIQGDSSWCINPDSLVAQRHIIPELGVYTVTTIWRWETGGISNEDYHDRFIWLPDQSQLQEMVSKNIQLLCGSIYTFSKTPYGYGFCTGYGGSMGQLWLAFVMKEKFGKVWAGTEWKHLE